MSCWTLTYTNLSHYGRSHELISVWSRKPSLEEMLERLSVMQYMGHGPLTLEHLNTLHATGITSIGVAEYESLDYTYFLKEFA